MVEGAPNSPIGVLDNTFFFLSVSLFSAFADISVAIKPGAMQFTRIPFGESSTAIARVMDSIAPLEALYAITFGNPYCDAIELILTMLPFLFFIIDFTTSLEIVKMDPTLVSIIS